MQVFKNNMNVVKFEEPKFFVPDAPGNDAGMIALD